MRDKHVMRTQKDFDLIYRKGKSVGDRYVVVFTRRNGLPYYRVGYLASKKVGNSVTRNRARRLMKESVRLAGYDFVPGYDYVFIARNTIKDTKCPQVQRSILSALRKTGVKRRK